MSALAGGGGGPPRDFSWRIKNDVTRHSPYKAYNSDMLGIHMYNMAIQVHALPCNM